jgi:hypothetical protein
MQAPPLTPGAPGTTLQCPLCGARFTPAEQAACARCALHGGCGLICCPNCGYSFLPPRQQESLPGRWTRLWRRLWTRRGAKD